MDRPTQFRVTQSILLFESSRRKEFFPAKEFISFASDAALKKVLRYGRATFWINVK